MTKDFKIVIPVRLASSRFPGKVLEDIAGKSMLQHVYECAQKTQASEIVIATDTLKIGMAAEEFGATVCMTSDTHQSGTDRIAEVVEKLKWDDDEVVINLQGDEPLMPAETINQVAFNLLTKGDANCATLFTNIDVSDDANNPNMVKVVHDKNGLALYFSRSLIPYHRTDTESDTVIYKRHIGLYAYRVATLKAFSNLAVSELENAEKLEQLRLMENGMKIHIAEAVALPGLGVDTPEDLEKVKQHFKDAKS